METIIQCPICNGKGFIPFIKCKDFTVSHETFQIVKCNNCNFKFTNPRPREIDIGRYYESDDYISHSNSKKGLFNTMYQIIRKRALKKKVKLIESFGSNSKILLDIGCGTGEFLNAANKEGWQVKGLEPSESARKYGINNYGLSVDKLDAISMLQKDSYNVITMWHVLEHVPNLHETISQLKTILKDNGTLLIAVPNCSANEERIYKEFWAAYDLPRHLNHFTKETMFKAMEINNLNIFKVLPMPFDSYYISMLSEKYLGAGLLKMATKGFWNGWKSNYAASKDITKSSSLIYLIKKMPSKN